MASVYTDLGKLTHQLCKGNRKMPFLDALLEARRQITEEQCSQVGDEVVPFSLLEAAKKQRRVEVEVDGFRYMFDRAMSESGMIEVDGANELLLVLQGPVSTQGGAETGDPPRIKTAGTYRIRLDNSATFLEGTYDLADAEQATLRSVKPGKRAKMGYVKHLPLQGLYAQGVAVKEKLPILELELYVRYSSVKGKPGVAVPTLQAVVVRVAMRPSKERLRRGTLTQTDRRGMMPSDSQKTPYEPPAPPSLNLEERTEMAKRMLAKFVQKDDTFSLMVVRDRKVLVDVESGSDRAVYSAGEVTQVLTTAAMVKHIMARPGAHAAGEVDLQSRKLLYNLLTESGATNVRDALVDLYARNNHALPSVAQLMTHTSGLGARAQVGMRDLQGMFADRGGIRSSGSSEQDFAMMLRNKTSVVDEPGGVYHESALNMAVMTFAMPGWDKNTSVLETIREMTGSEGQVSFADMPTQEGYQGLYKMYAGLRADVGSMAMALSHPGWYAQSTSSGAGSMDWLQKLSEPRVLVSREKQMAAGYGSWMNGKLDGEPARYAIGRFEKDVMMVVQLPNSATTAVFAMRKRDSPLSCALPVLKDMVHTIKQMVDGGGAPRKGRALGLQLPVASRAAAASQQRARAVLASSGRVDEEDRDLVRYYGGELVGLLDRDSSLTLKSARTHPDMTRRYVATMQHGVWKQQWTVVMDDNRAPDPENVAGARGGLRVIDPLTGSMTESLFMGLLRSETDPSRAEPVVMFMGRVFVKREFAAEVEGAMDPNSREARERTMAREAALVRQRERQRSIRDERSKRVRAARAEGDQSSDEEDEPESESAPAYGRTLGPNDDVGDRVLVEVGDLFERLRNGNMRGPTNGRVTVGNWYRYIGCDSCSKKAGMCAYPTGERIVAVNDYYD